MGEVAQELYGRRVCPVEVFQDHHYWPVASRGGQCIAELTCEPCRCGWSRSDVLARICGGKLGPPARGMRSNELVQPIACIGDQRRQCVNHRHVRFTRAAVFDGLAAADEHV